MFFNKFGKQVLFGMVLAGVSLAAAAGTVDTTDVFYEFMYTIQKWATGPFGIGLAILSLLIGAVYGVSKNSPMPALAGIAMAAILYWGPTIIINLMTGGAVI